MTKRRLKRLRRSPLQVTFFVLVAVSANAAAQTAEERGTAIAREVDRRASGYRDFTARLTMVLVSRDGGEKTREMRVQVLEGESGDRTLLTFERPRDLRGTALLTIEASGESDGQWLYLPALKRVKRIASNGQAGSFMGSEFAYEDIGSQQVEKFEHRHLRDESLGGTQAFVVERYPVDESSGYRRQVVWIDKAEYRPLRVDYYDRDDELLKTLELNDYRLYEAKYWRPGELVMVNHRSGRATRLLWSDLEFQTGLSERDFTRASLERVR